MPYLKDKKLKKRIDILIAWFKFYSNESKESKTISGELNYFIFKLAKGYIHNYTTAKEFIGELECAKQEIYRRIVAPYEDEKIKENGDVE
jgi:hypothetical protein